MAFQLFRRVSSIQKLKKSSKSQVSLGFDDEKRETKSITSFQNLTDNTIQSIQYSLLECQVNKKTSSINFDFQNVVFVDKNKFKDKGFEIEKSCLESI